MPIIGEPLSKVILKLELLREDRVLLVYISFEVVVIPVVVISSPTILSKLHCRGRVGLQLMLNTAAGSRTNAVVASSS